MFSVRRSENRIFISDKFHTFGNATLIRSRHWRCSARKDILRNFAKFTGKHLWQGLFFNTAASMRLAALGVFLRILLNFLEHLFYRTSLGNYCYLMLNLKLKLKIKIKLELCWYFIILKFIFYLSLYTQNYPLVKFYVKKIISVNGHWQTE